MKAIGRIIGRLTIGYVLALGLTSNLYAQDQESPLGTYYSAKDPDLPPMPYNPHPELEAVEVEPGVFLVDDTGVPDTPEQAAARAARQTAAQEPPDLAAEAAREAAQEATLTANRAAVAPWLVGTLNLRKCQQNQNHFKPSFRLDSVHLWSTWKCRRSGVASFRRLWNWRGSSEV